MVLNIQFVGHKLVLFAKSDVGEQINKVQLT